MLLKLAAFIAGIIIMEFILRWTYNSFQKDDILISARIFLSIHISLLHKAWLVNFQET
ncbi:MAG: hypothetical protein K2X86_01750 [Cytophagaceae bacterium]|nr:hypothetical protein [Cytophagaceae bacterium]